MNVLIDCLHSLGRPSFEGYSLPMLFLHMLSQACRHAKTYLLRSSGAIKHHYNSYTHAIMALAGVTAVACVMVYYLPLPGFAGLPLRPAQDKPLAKSGQTADGGRLARLRDWPKHAEQD